MLDGAEMKADRREFLRIAIGAYAALLGRHRSAAAADSPIPEIHAATVNHRFGPAGERRPKEPLATFKPYPGLPRVKLPPVETGPVLSLSTAVERYATAPGFRPVPLALAELARLLQLSNGVTGSARLGAHEVQLRAAPSAGALYAGEMYVVAERIEGLEPGVYSFAVEERALVRLRSGSHATTVLDAVERPGLLENASAFVVLTNVFGRYTRRYANRGYRYALIDSGHIGENLRLAAIATGLAEVTEFRFHDQALNALLEVELPHEATCALHAVGLPASAESPHPDEPRSLVELQHVPSAAITQREAVTDRYHEATQLITAAIGSASPAASTRLQWGTLRENPSGTGASVRAVIEQRRSPLRFRKTPISVPQLRFVAALARGTPELQHGPDIDLYVIAHRVRALEPGLYRFDAGLAEFALLHRGDLTRSLVRACGDQQNAGRAAAAFFMVAGFSDASVSRLGDRSYRDALMEAGAIAERIYLAAEAAGMAARNLAAFRDANLNDLLGLDPDRKAVLHLTVLGQSVA
jgi:SagB-type dehydrogenase family enzyme